MFTPLKPSSDYKQFRLHNRCSTPINKCNIPQMQKLQQPRQFKDNLKCVRIIVAVFIFINNWYVMNLKFSGCNVR